MAKITIKVDPDNKTPVGWDVNCFSWSADEVHMINHVLTWSPPAAGVFVAKTGELPSGTYGLHVAVVGPGRKIKVSAGDGTRVVDPRNSNWPMSVDADAATSTQASDTWYFAFTA